MFGVIAFDWKSRTLADERLDHGDHVAITPSRRGNGGGVIMLGRSDGVLYVQLKSH